MHITAVQGSAETDTTMIAIRVSGRYHILNITVSHHKSQNVGTKLQLDPNFCRSASKQAFTLSILKHKMFGNFITNV